MATGDNTNSIEWKQQQQQLAGMIPAMDSSSTLQVVELIVENVFGTSVDGLWNQKCQFVSVLTDGWHTNSSICIVLHSSRQDKRQKRKKNYTQKKMIDEWWVQCTAIHNLHRDVSVCVWAIAPSRVSSPNCRRWHCMMWASQCPDEWTARWGRNRTCQLRKET